MGWGSRLPTSNDLPQNSKNKAPWVIDVGFRDEVGLIVNGLAGYCRGGCRRLTYVEYLDEERRCPDCRPRE